MKTNHKSLNKNKVDSSRWQKVKTVLRAKKSSRVRRTKENMAASTDHPDNFEITNIEEMDMSQPFPAKRSNSASSQMNIES